MDKIDRFFYLPKIQKLINLSKKDNVNIERLIEDAFLIGRDCGREEAIKDMMLYLALKNTY